MEPDVWPPDDDREPIAPGDERYYATPRCRRCDFELVIGERHGEYGGYCRPCWEARFAREVGNDE